MRWLRLYIHNIWIQMERMREMMAMLFACRVIEGRMEFNTVPAKLRQAVADVLVQDFASPELVPAAYGGTLEE